MLVLALAVVLAVVVVVGGQSTSAGWECRSLPSKSVVVGDESDGPSPSQERGEEKSSVLMLARWEECDSSARSAWVVVELRRA